MKKTLTSAACCAAAVLMSTGVFAQSQNDQQSQSGSSGSGQQNSALQQANAQEFFRASTLSGKNVQDAKGNKIGEIKDISFNQRGDVFAFVNVGNSKWAVVPWQVVNPSTAKGNGNVTLNATAQQVKAGPAVSEKQWGSLDNPQFVQGCYTYYNIQSPNATGGASSPGGSSQGQEQGAASSSQSQPSSSSGSQTNSSSGGQSQ